MDRVEKSGALVQVGLDGMGLGEVVSKVIGARCPVDAVLLLLDPITDPVVAHVNGLGAFNADGLVGDTLGGGVVGNDGSGGLWVTEVGEGCAGGHTELAIQEEASKFCFGSGGNDGGNDGADDVDGSIDRGMDRVSVGGKVVKTTSS